MTCYSYTLTDNDGDTFILKKVILVRRSTVDLRSCSLSGLLAGKLFCSKTERKIYSETQHITTHPCPVCVCEHYKARQYNFHCDIQHLLRCGCVSRIQSAVIVINTSVCFIFTGSHKMKDGEKEEHGKEVRKKRMCKCEYPVNVV